MRISQIGAPGIPNPGSVFPNDVTRVSISHNPNTPVTRPLSLLHLGYNTQGATNDGWRPWMDVGMYVSQSSDNVFLGLKNESLTPLGDQLDAVLSWGDNQVNSGLPPFNGPDKFRFIFTSSQAPSSPGSTQAKSANGLEAMRMNPTLINGVYTGIGGDPSGNLYSGGVPNPNNTLEVNSWGVTTNPGGSSGLRLTNLTIASPTIANPGIGVLSVDANGDVIYVQGGGVTNANNGLIANGTNVQLGGDCSSPSQVSAAAFLSNREIPLNGFNMMYSGTNGNFGIGHPTAACNTIFGRFEVLNTTRRSAIVGQSSFSHPSGVFGVLGEGSNSGPGNAIGVRGQAMSCTPNGNAIGIKGESELNTNENNYGGFFVANSAIKVNIAVYGNAPTGVLTPTSGVQPTTGNYAGYFNGNVVRTGSDNFTSDQILKQNIDTIPNAMGIINQLKPKSYDYKQSSFPSMNLPSGKQYGLIAQDVQTVLPELVNNNTHPAELDSVGNIINPSFNYLSLEYQQLIAIMLKGMQEQQAQIKQQDSLITALSNQINSCCSNTTSRNANSNINQLDVELSDKDAIVLNQNVPNPFAEQTTITYNVPASVEKAQLIFFNANGQVIQTVDIKTRGKGKVNVFAADLSSGLYHYTLVADGKVVDSKKMVRE